jgi:hypothetical protein
MRDETSTSSSVYHHPCSGEGSNVAGVSADASVLFIKPFMACAVAITSTKNESMRSKQWAAVLQIHVYWLETGKSSLGLTSVRNELAIDKLQLLFVNC